MARANYNCLNFCSLPLGGGNVRNIRLQQTGLYDLLVEWDHAQFIPRRGYKIRVAPSQGVDEGVDMFTTSFTITITTGVGTKNITVWPLSDHFASYPVTKMVKFRGEK